MINMDSTAVTLARTQFAVTSLFHITWPLLTIGLSFFLVVMEAIWLKTGDESYYRHVRFWSRLLVVVFGIGVASGIPLEFQFGTNWSAFASFGGPVVGNLLAFEAAMSFALEAAFLAIFIFGWGRVSKRMHFFASIMVAFGASLSAFWIMCANAWMQTPAGYSIVGQHVVITDYRAAVLNPDAMLAFAHMWVACIEASLFFVAAICAWNIKQAKNTAFFLKIFKIMVVAGIIVTPLQIYLGDASSRTVETYQPAKLAAMEANWSPNAPGTPASWAIVAWPDAQAQDNLWEIKIPYLLSILSTHTLTGQVPGLREFPVENQPPVAIPFYAFRIMVISGFAMLFLIFWALWKWRKRGLEAGSAPRNRLFWSLWTYALPLGFIATYLGWAVREVGRQPWVIYNVMRTAVGVSPVSPSVTAGSLAMFVMIYIFLMAVFIYFARRIVIKGPDMSATYARDKRPGKSYRD
jgi:cytochrome d ubiquinol oxidase subunit I